MMSVLAPFLLLSAVFTLAATFPAHLYPPSDRREEIIGEIHRCRLSPIARLSWRLELLSLAVVEAPRLRLAATRWPRSLRNGHPTRTTLGIGRDVCFGLLSVFVMVRWAITGEVLYPMVQQLPTVVTCCLALSLTGCGYFAATAIARWWRGPLVASVTRSGRGVGRGVGS